MVFPSVEAVPKSPAFPTAIWRLQPHQYGLLPVAAERGGPLNISWEIHGEGPIKLIVSIFLNLPIPHDSSPNKISSSVALAWQRRIGSSKPCTSVTNVEIGTPCSSLIIAVRASQISR